MALLVLIVLGTTLGWLSSIIARTEEPGEILRQIMTGLLVAMVSGLLVNGGVVLGGLSPVALGVALSASVGALVLYHAVIGRQIEA